MLASIPKIMSTGVLLTIGHFPFLCAVQYGEGGGKWGRRRPRWLMVERAYLHNLWRASQAAHRWWATTDTPSAPLASIPTMHKVGHTWLLLYCNPMQPAM